MQNGWNTELKHERKRKEETQDQDRWERRIDRNGKPTTTSGFHQYLNRGSIPSQYLFKKTKRKQKQKTESQNPGRGEGEIHRWSIVCVDVHTDSKFLFPLLSRINTSKGTNRQERKKYEWNVIEETEGRSKLNCDSWVESTASNFSYLLSKQRSADVITANN